MKFLPKISIIMNCHNGENFLKESLNSILSQSYKNWELIFFDNKSMDNSQNILKKIKDKRFRYFKSQKKLTLYKARNSAIKHTKGSYITFLDVDDQWHKDKLTKQVEMVNKKNSNFIFTNYYILKKKNKKKCFRKKPPSGFVTRHILKSNFIPIVTVMFKKKLLKKFKLNFNNKYNIIGDFDLFIKLSKYVKFDYIHQPLANYRLHEKNYSKKNSNSYYKELMFWYKKNRNTFKIYNFYNFLLNAEYIKIKSDIYMKNYIAALVSFFKFPLCLKKIKLFVLFFTLKKLYDF